MPVTKRRILFRKPNELQKSRKLITGIHKELKKKESTSSKNEVTSFRKLNVY